MNKGVAKFLVAIFILGFFGTGMMLVMAYEHGWENYSEARVQPVDYSHNIHVQLNKMKCTQCHLNVDKTAKATIPPVSVCMGCHTKTAVDKEGVKVLTSYWNEGQPIVWKKIHTIPKVGMVYFTHKRHVKFLMPLNLEQEFLGQGLPEGVAKAMAAEFGMRVTQEYTPDEIKAALLMHNVDSELASKVSTQWPVVQDRSSKETCYACHGKVEYMKNPRKISPMKMGWCVTCHVKNHGPRDCTTCHQ